MTQKDIAQIDASNMFNILRDFPKQVEEAVKIGQTAPTLDTVPTGRHLAILGMGGSAIGGDLLRSYVSSLHSPAKRIVSVVRNYNLPDFIAHEDMVIASSYSGGTEETLSAFAQAVKRTKNVFCITTGGELTLQARAYSFPLIRLPEGLQPRCALGYSFFPMITTLNRMEYFGSEAKAEIESGIKETITLLKKKSDIYTQLNKKNPAYALAEKLYDNIPVVYAPAETFDTVGVRWKGQFNENSKNLAFCNVIPEMNHNEIEGWNLPKKHTKKLFVILLRDDFEHKRVSLRFEILKELLAKKTAGIEEFWSEGESAIARMFSLIYLGDWVSYYLAILNGVDPTAIPNISSLKKMLAKPQA
jgi:glucose/mannose-6-phosphate isomerase